MKDQALQIAAAAPDDRTARNQLREYLQHVILRALFERDGLEHLVFHGGTALRIVHGLPRFSEDLDFHTTAPEVPFDLAAHLDDLTVDLHQAGYSVELIPKLTGDVQSAMVKFVGLLHDAGLHARAEAKLNVKLEIDRNPPDGFAVTRTPVNTYFPFVVKNHDRPTFLAGKLHAVLQRPSPKGRDYYDLMFYLQRWSDVEPNLPYLRNALRQTQYAGAPVADDTWRQVIADQVEAVDWGRIHEDVAPFLFRPADVKAFQKQMLLLLLRGSDG